LNGGSERRVACPTLADEERARKHTRHEGDHGELDEAMEACFESYRSGDGISVERRYVVVTGVRR